ncbi:MotA/TolQ/ExbB proton channel family protein [Jiella mangrovi]|uniref:MotA/TolQ/ExbB proton channel family protein n=1 Tax=Jiella mangrovi TaxID=2821407 RepID=A0ABS4BIZ5_9HYPH|nr:MotA/TolQ/ExbB proton channel family protein [Jiella mangrovi]MBP0616739.1 MotA/TolQ/ExbB proton channel family protein [Jiella mangrovi]
MWDIVDTQLRSSAGPILLALLLLSIAGLAVAIVKFTEFRGQGVGRAAGGTSPGRDRPGGPAPIRARIRAVARDALAAGAGGRDARERAGALAEEAAIEGLGRLSRHLPLLDAIVQAAPMLGLLGTVFGMIEVFSTMSGTDGAIDPALLSGGIFAALLTTAAGLVVAIPFFFIAAYFDAALDSETRAIEAMILRTIHGEPPRATQAAPANRPEAAPLPATAGGLAGGTLARPR